MAALVAASAAGAQSSVALYGLVDIGIEQVNKVGGNGPLRRVPSNTNTAATRLGLRGTEDLGDGLRAVFTLEMGFDPGNGLFTQGGRAWGRQALVGLSGRLGAVTVGRLYTMTFWAAIDADTHGGGIYGTGSLDSYLPNARADNAIAWRNRFGGLDLGVQASLGRDGVNAGPSPAGTNCPGENADSKACRQWSMMAKYDTSGWGLALASDRLDGRHVGAAPDAVFGGLNASGRSDRRLSANGWVKVGQVRWGGGLVRRHNDGLPARKKSNLWYAGAQANLGTWWLLSAQHVALKHDGASDFDAQLWSARATYLLSGRSSVFAQVAHIRNERFASLSVSGGAPGSNPAAGAGQTAFNVGVRHSF